MVTYFGGTPPLFWWYPHYYFGGTHYDFGGRYHDYEAGCGVLLFLGAPSG